jgi:hypothetical protein
MAAIKSRFHNSCFIVSFPSQCRDSKNSDMELDQWSRYDLGSMVVIKSGFFISQNQDSMDDIT